MNSDTRLYFVAGSYIHHPFVMLASVFKASYQVQSVLPVQAASSQLICILLADKADTADWATALFALIICLVQMLG